MLKLLLMLEWFGTAFNAVKSVASGAKREREVHQAQKRALLHDFVLEAIGMRGCLSLDNDERGTVSLNTIEIRIRMLQESEPDRAHRCGVPGMNDEQRIQEISCILQDMVMAGRLKRCLRPNRWHVT